MKQSESVIDFPLFFLYTCTLLKKKFHMVWFGYRFHKAVCKEQAPQHI